MFRNNTGLNSATSNIYCEQLCRVDVVHYFCCKKKICGVAFNSCTSSCTHKNSFPLWTYLWNAGATTGRWPVYICIQPAWQLKKCINIKTLIFTFFNIKTLVLSTLVCVIQTLFVSKKLNSLKNLIYGHDKENSTVIQNLLSLISVCLYGTNFKIFFTHCLKTIDIIVS